MTVAELPATAHDGVDRASTARRRGMRQAARPWLFLTPALALLALFTFWPVIAGTLLAFTEYNFL